VRPVARFNGADNVDCRDVGAGESPVVHHLFDARADGSDLRSEIGEAARPVADHRSETRKASVRDEAAFDDPAQDVRIDIAAAKQNDDAFSGELGQLSGKTGGQSGSGGAFDHAFFQFDNAQDRESNLFLVNENQFVGVLARSCKGVAANLGNGKSVGQGRASFDPHWVVGAARSVFTGRSVFRSGMDMFVVGLGVAAVGYFVGEWVAKLL